MHLLKNMNIYYMSMYKKIIVFHMLKINKTTSSIELLTRKQLNEINNSRKETISTYFLRNSDLSTNIENGDEVNGLTLFLVSLLVMSCAFCPPVFAFNEPSLTQLPPSLNSFCIECQNVFCPYFWACTVLPSHTTAAVDLVWPNLIHYDASWSQRSLMHCGQWGYQKFFYEPFKFSIHTTIIVSVCSTVIRPVF